MDIPLDRIRVLLVDDDPEFAEMAATFLEREDERYAVETVTSADAGLDRLADAPFDCLVSDYGMPAMDGIELLLAVREEYPDLPFVLLTGKGSEEVASDAISAGATDYLEKRSGTDQYTVLANRVANAVEQYTLQRERDRTVARITDAVLRVSSDWQIIFVNDQATALYDATEAEMLGQSFWELFADVHNTSLADTYRSVMETREAASLEAQTEVLEGWFQIDVYPNPDGGLSFYFHDITERKQRERRFRALVEGSSDVISIVDADGRFQYQSPSLERIMGLDPEETVGDTAWEYIHPDDREAVIDTFEEWKRTPEATTSVEYRARHADGSWRWFEARGYGQFDDPAIDGYVVNSRDITERKERERRLQRQNERLDKFTSVVSHDLRNPLNVASARLELARDECDSSHLQDVAGAHERMERLIDDLLTFARAGSEAIDRRTVALPRLLDGCWETLQNEDAALVVETEQEVLADRDRLQQLVENLLTNAVDHGGTDVTVRVGDLEEGFYVEDDGQGIPASDREEVFEAGYSSARGGTGFGLSIVEQVAEAHGWSVEVTESPDGGARFEITGVEFPG